LPVAGSIFGFTGGTRGLGVHARFGVVDADEVKALFLPLFPSLSVLGAPYGVRLNISVASVIERSRVVLVTPRPLPLALVILFLPLTFAGSGSKTGALLLSITPIGFVKC
jgi:hypothetical protein